MLLGNTAVIACPHCGALGHYQTFISGNNAGARFWTDGGDDEDPLFPQPPDVVGCRGCGRPYWRELASVVAEVAPRDRQLFDDGSEYAGALPVEEPTEASYYAAITGGLAQNREQEYALRLSAMWKRNDPVRRGAGEPDGSLTEQAVANLAALSMLIDEAGRPFETLMKVEVLRELGKFDEALRILLVFDRRLYNGRRDYQISLCERRIVAVQEVPLSAFEVVRGLPKRPESEGE